MTESPTGTGVPASSADHAIGTPTTSAALHGAVRTRFAPSPTGMLHIGGARTALYAWAFARHHDGRFILRIEDTDVERSTPQAVQAIIDGMAWLGLDADEGPYFQMQRMPRYREIIDAMLADGRAYHCWATPAELDEMREAQRARGDKPRYDGRWRPERAAGRTPPAGVPPVVRFRNPDDGVVGWHDLVKGPIAVANAELDDLVIARADGTPTYNFCVVVDDMDMRISHVIRGDDHVNNTPRQINILRALGADVPVYGHLPMIHGPDGQKLSKRHGALSVLEYDALGYLPEAVLNYLARLGWSHGDDEIFDRGQMVAWFDGSHLSHSPSQLDFDKFRWVNQQHLKAMSDAALAERVLPRLRRAVAAAAAAGTGVADITADPPPGFASMIGLLKERATTLEALAADLLMFVAPPAAPREALDRHLVPAACAALGRLADALSALPAASWTREAIAASVKGVLADTGLKMPQLAIPLRLAVFGREQTPSVDAMLAALPRDVAIARLAAASGGQADAPVAGTVASSGGA
ncbi:MAG: glutamate--tRNA ligase [Lautropia sp.]